MPSTSKSKVRRVGKPLLLLRRGVGATAKGVWHLAKAVPRRTRGPPLASLSAATMQFDATDPYWSHPGSGAGSGSASDVGSSSAAATGAWLGLPQLQLPAWLAPWAGQQQNQQAETNTDSSRVIEMFNPESSWAMAITPVQQRHTSSSSSSGNSGSSWRAAHTSHHHHDHISYSSSSSWYGKQHPGSSSSPSGSASTASGTSQQQQQQQQLLSIGCRHWRGLLKIYEFAIFIDGEQAGAFLPAAISSSSSSSRRSSSNKRSKLLQQPLLLEGPPADHQQQQQQGQAEASSSGSGNWLTGALASLLPVLPLGGLALAAAGAGISNSSGSSGAPSAALAAADGSTTQQLSRKERRQQRRQQQAAAKLLKQQRRTAAAAAGAGAALTAATGASSGQASSSSSTDLPGLVKASSSGVGMSLVLKAAREVPLHLLAEEYEKVLRRRLARVGGNDVSDVTALGQLLDSFRHPERLPAVVRGGGGGSVRKGAMIVFEREGASGTIVARVGPHILGTVSGSPKLAEALFDLYLGQQPVSQAAKDAAADTLARIAHHHTASTSASSTTSSSRDVGGSASAAPYYLPQGRHEQIRCRQQQAGAAGGGSGLGVADLAACMLHLE